MPFHTAARCTQLSAEVGAAQSEAARQIEALKEQLGRELRRQKVGGESLEGTCTLVVWGMWALCALLAGRVGRESKGGACERRARA